MTLDFITDVFITLLILPIQVILIPIDSVLAQIPNIGIIPSSLNAITSFIGSTPQTLVTFMGVSPHLWNSVFLIFVLYISASPTIQIVKKVWAWVRP